MAVCLPNAVEVEGLAICGVVRYLLETVHAAKLIATRVI